jgi:hypothetical protein
VRRHLARDDQNLDFMPVTPDAPAIFRVRIGWVSRDLFRAQAGHHSDGAGVDKMRLCREFDLHGAARVGQTEVIPQDLPRNEEDEPPLA